MNKMNKKGFTLIEMLVVIAIIAVLVAIVVPVVSSSTEKAAASANAANLRTVAAQVSVWKLENNALATPAGGTAAANGTLTLTVGSETFTCEAPAAKAVSALGINGGEALTVVISDGNVSCTYGGKTVYDFSDVAEDGKVGS